MTKEIEETKNLVRFINKPQRHGPVLVSDRPWEARNRVQAWGSVIREPNGLFRIWYAAFFLDRRPVEVDRSADCYAESSDGFHWEKPNLGVCKYRGSWDNNIFYCFHPNRIHMTEEMLARRRLGLPAMTLDGQHIGILNNMDGIGGVLRDPDEPDPDKRYKLIAKPCRTISCGVGGMRSCILVSLRIRSKRRDKSLVSTWIPALTASIWARKPVRLLSARGDYMMVMRDHRKKRWWLNERTHGQGGRNAALRSSKDLIEWTDPELIFDNLEDSQHGRLWEWHGGHDTL